MKSKIIIGLLAVAVCVSAVVYFNSDNKQDADKDKNVTQSQQPQIEDEKEQFTDDEIENKEKPTVSSEANITSETETLTEENPKENSEQSTVQPPQTVDIEPLPPILTPAQEDKLVEEQLEANSDWIDEFRQTKGCPICKDTDCPSLYGKDEWGQDDIDLSLCTDYSAEDDPLLVCTHCDKKKGNGENGTCIRYLEDTICEHCGAEVLLLECHTCEN